jgi:hypothetical protein
MAPFAEISSVADVLGGLIGAAIGVLVIVYRRQIARSAAQGLHLGGSETSLAQVYAVLGAFAIVIAIGSIFVL